MFNIVLNGFKVSNKYSKKTSIEAVLIFLMLPFEQIQLSNQYNDQNTPGRFSDVFRGYRNGILD